MCVLGVALDSRFIVCPLSFLSYVELCCQNAKFVQVFCKAHIRRHITKTRRWTFVKGTLNLKAKLLRAFWNVIRVHFCKTKKDTLWFLGFHSTGRKCILTFLLEWRKIYLFMYLMSWELNSNRISGRPVITKAWGVADATFHNNSWNQKVHFF